jgi:hypothetical protein
MSHNRPSSDPMSEAWEASVLATELRPLIVSDCTQELVLRTAGSSPIVPRQFPMLWQRCPRGLRSNRLPKKIRRNLFLPRLYIYPLRPQNGQDQRHRDSYRHFGKPMKTRLATQALFAAPSGTNRTTASVSPPNLNALRSDRTRAQSNPRKNTLKPNTNSRNPK